MMPWYCTASSVALKATGTLVKRRMVPESTRSASPSVTTRSVPWRRNSSSTAPCRWTSSPVSRVRLVKRSMRMVRAPSGTAVPVPARW